MLKISNQANGYKIKLSNPGSGKRGKSIFAQNVAELHEAIDHYYMATLGHWGENENCPLCRDMQQRS